MNVLYFTFRVQNMKVIDGKPEYKGAVVSRICYMITQ